MHFEILYKKLLIYLCRKAISLVDSLIFLYKTYEGQEKQIQKSLRLFLSFVC